MFSTLWRQSVVGITERKSRRVAVQESDDAFKIQENTIKQKQQQQQKTFLKLIYSRQFQPHVGKNHFLIETWALQSTAEAEMPSTVVNRIQR